MVIYRAIFYVLFFTGAMGMAVGIYAQTEYQDWPAHIKKTDSLSLLFLDKDLDSAEYYAQRLINYGKSHNAELILATGYAQFGIVNSLRGDLSSGLELLDTSFSIRKRLGNEMGMIRSLIDIANVYINKGDLLVRDTLFDEADSNYMKAISFNEQAVTLSKKNGYIYWQGSAESNIGSAYLRMGWGEDALLYFESSKKLFERLGEGDKIMSAITNITAAKQALGESDGLMEDYEQLKVYFQKSGNLANLITIYINMAELMKENNNMKKSIIQLEHADSLASSIGDISQQAKIQENLADTYSNLGNYKLSMEHYRKYNALKAELLSLESVAKLEELNIKYETEKKDKELTVQKLQNLEKDQQIKVSNQEKQTVILVSIIFLVILLSITILLIWRQRVQRQTAIKDKLLHDQEVQKMLSEQELKSLETMIHAKETERKRIAEDLHDRLGNTLTAARMFVEVQQLVDNNKVLGLLDKAITETREIAYDMLSGVLDKFGLEAALNDLRNSIAGVDNVKFLLKVDLKGERLTSELELHLYRISQELISNSLKHADPTILKLDFFKQSDRLELNYSDNGEGFEMDKITPGMGLNNIRSRVASCEGVVKFISRPNEGMTAQIFIEHD